MAESVTRFGAVDENFSKTIDSMEGRLQGFTGEVQEVGKQTSVLPGLFFKAAAAVAAFVGGFVAAQVSIRTFMDAIEAAGALDDLALKTGETAGNLAVLSRAFQLAGMSAGDVGPVIGKLQKFIFDAGQEGSKAATVLEWFQLSLEDVADKTPVELMELFAEKIQQIEDPTKRAAAAQLLLNKSGTDALPLFLELAENIQKSRAQLGAYPEAIDRAGKAMADIGDHLDAIKNKGVEFATGLLVNVAPGLAEVTKRIAEIDAARLGIILSDHLAAFMKAADGALGFTKNLNAVRVAISGLADGQMSDGLSLLFVTAKIQALELVNEFVKSFVAGIQAIGGFFATVFGADSALMTLMGRTFEFAGKKLESAFAAAFAVIFAQIPVIGPGIAQSLTAISQAAEVESQAVKWYMGQAASNVAKELFAAGAAMPAAFAQNRSKLQPLFDLNPLYAEQHMLVQKISAGLAKSGQGAGDVASNMGQAADKSGKFAKDVAAAKTDVKGAVDFTTGPGGIAAAAKDAAQKTSEGASKVTKAFDGATQVGANFEKAVKQSANDFYKVSVDAGRTFKQEVIGSLSWLTDSFKGIATEGTLRRAVASLERLERKLPQPVLS